MESHYGDTGEVRSSSYAGSLHGDHEWPGLSKTRIGSHAEPSEALAPLPLSLSGWLTSSLFYLVMSTYAVSHA